MIPVAMHLIVKDALKLLRPAIPTTIDIRTRVDSGCDVIGDPSQIHRIIMNSCTNAYQEMMASGGILGLSLAKVMITDHAAVDSIVPGSYAMLTVADTGRGIAPDHLAGSMRFPVKGPAAHPGGVVFNPFPPTFPLDDPGSATRFDS